MICQQCGTENTNSRVLCQKCGKSLHPDSVKGIVTCKNHGNRQSTTICEQCLRPICEECTVVLGGRVLCVEDGRLDLSEDEEDRIEHLSVGDPSIILHAGFATRLISLLIDAVILGIVAILLAAVFWLITGVAPTYVASGRTGSNEFLLFWAIYIVIVFAYSVVLTASEGQTFGKQAMSIAVVEKDGTTPSLSRAFARSIYSIFSMVCLGAGFFAIIRDPAKQAWHDRWANTYVISLDEATERL